MRGSTLRGEDGLGSNPSRSAIRKEYAMSNIIPEYEGRNRPEINSDRLGYPPEVGDQEWDKLKKLYKKVPGGWIRK